MDLRQYQLSCFKGSVHIDSENKFCFKTENNFFSIVGAFDKNLIGELIEVWGLPIYGVSCGNQIFIDTCLVVSV